MFLPDIGWVGTLSELAVNTIYLITVSDYAVYTYPFAELTGCTDPEAMNYDPDATFPDGSCLYDCSGCFSAGCDEGYSCWDIFDFCV